MGTYYEIVARSSGKCIDVANESEDDATELIQWTRQGGHNQQWKLQQADNQWYYIIARHSGKVIDVPSESMEMGENLIQYKKNGQDNQQWRFIKEST